MIRVMGSRITGDPLVVEPEVPLGDGSWLDARAANHIAEANPVVAECSWSGSPWVRLENLAEPPAWDRGRHQLIADLPEAEEYRGRSLMSDQGRLTCVARR
jgi:hypothetical protein